MRKLSFGDGNFGRGSLGVFFWLGSGSDDRAGKFGNFISSPILPISPYLHPADMRYMDRCFLDTWVN